MKKNVDREEKEVQKLQSRVTELERQLEEAKAAISALPSPEPQNRTMDTHPEPKQSLAPGQSTREDQYLQSALMVAPHPLMIRRDDGRVMMINRAWTKVTGYALEDIPTIDDWTRRAYGEQGDQRRTFIAEKGFSQNAVKNWGEFEITTRSGEKRIWNFSTAPLGFDGSGRELVMVMAMDLTEHKQTEEALRKSEEKFSRVFHSNPAGMTITRIADAQYTDVNDSFCQIVGFTREQIIGRTSLEMGFFTKTEREEVMRQFQAHGRVHNQEFNVVTSHKLTRRVLFSLDPIEVAGEPSILATMIDITERKKAEEALAESERRQREITRLLELDQARLAAILRHLPVGVWIADQNGRLIGSNEEADRIWGGEAALLNSMAEYDKYVAWHPESGEFLRSEEYPVAVALRTGESAGPLELNIRRFDGTEGTVLASAAPIKDRQQLLTGAVGVNVDITDRKKAEEDLRKSEERFAKAFHASPDAISISRMSDGLVMEVNEGWKKLFGHEQNEVLGRTSIELGIYVNPEDRNRIITRLRETGYIRDFELELRRKSGEVRQVTLSSEKLEISGVACLLTVIRDITESKQAEQALRESEQRLNRAQEIAHLGSWELDLITNRLTWSDEVYRVFGLQPQEFGATYEAFLEAVHPDDRAAVDDAYFSSIREGRDMYEIEHRVIKRLSGEVRIVHEKCEHIRNRDGQIIRSIGMVHDVTEQKQFEKALEASKNRINDILKSLGGGLLALDCNWSIIYVNDQAAEIAGMPATDLIGKTLWELWPGLLGTQLEKSYRQAMNARVVEQFQVQGSQSGRWYDVSVSPSSEGITIFYMDKTEQILAEERFNQAFHMSPNGLVISRQEDGKIETVNQTFLTFFGYSEDEVIGKTSTELGMFVHPADRQEAIRRLQRDRSLRDFELEVRLRSGEVRNVSLSIEIMNVDDKGTMLTMIQDITQRKQYEEKLRAARDEAMWLARLPGENPNPVARVSDTGIVLYHNPPAATLPGWRCAVNQPLFEPLLGLVPQALAQGQVMEQDVSLGDKVYSVSVVPIRGETYANLYGRDITDREKVEQALRESEERFHSLADSMPQLVWTALPDGRVDYYNQRYQEYSEIKQLQVAAWDWSPVLHPEDLEPTVAAWKHSVETGDIYQIEHRVRMADGSYRWHLSRGIPVVHEDGEIIRWFGTATDIHDLKLAQEELKDYAERLERSNRELEQFAFMASHDLQEPLRKIEMFSDLLEERAAGLNDRDRSYLERMRNAAGRMRAMVAGLLELSRVSTQGKPFTTVDLSQVISEVLADLENQIRRTGGKVEVSPLPAIEGDPVQLRQLLQNLIGNALKFHRPDGPPEVKVYANRLPEKLRIVVQDHGIGFAEEDAERIFQPFQRLVGRTEYEGSGIGLAICRRIVERHAGNISAVGIPGHGATFIVTLPLHRSDSTKSEARKDANNEE